MINLEDNKQRTFQRVSENLNISPSQVGSYLHTVVDGLYRVGEDVTNELYNDILNTRVETADEATLDLFGAHLGVPRVRNKHASFSKYREDMEVKVDYHRESSGLPLVLYEKGSKIVTEHYEILFTEDLVFNPLAVYNYVSCFIKPVYSFENNSSLVDGTIIVLDIPKKYSEDIKGIHLAVLQPKYFNKEEEDLTNYRKRLLGVLEARNVSGSHAIDQALRSIPGVYSYSLDQHSVPQRLAIMNFDMYSSKQADGVVDANVVPLVHRVLDSIKPYNTNFDIRIAKGINIHFVVETNSKELTADVVNATINLIFLDHQLGEGMFVGRRYMDATLAMMGIEAEYRLKLYHEFRGYRELSETPEMIYVGPNEFPRVLTLNVLPLEEREYV